MRADLREQFVETKNRIGLALVRVGKPTFGGHAFIWGDIPVTLKNGKQKWYRTCITSVCSDDLGGCIELAEQMGARNVYYNLD